MEITNMRMKRTFEKIKLYKEIRALHHSSIVKAILFQGHKSKSDTFKCFRKLVYFKSRKKFHYLVEALQCFQQKKEKKMLHDKQGYIT